MRQGKLEKDEGNERKSVTKEECERARERDGGNKRNEERRNE
jgi:hypothetical protein